MFMCTTIFVHNIDLEIHSSPHSSPYSSITTSKEQKAFLMRNKCQIFLNLSLTLCDSPST